MSTATLVAHVDTKVVTREQVFAVATPAATKTHRPVPHREVVETVMEQLDKRGHVVTSEKYSLSSDGFKLFGVLETRPAGLPDGIGIAVGFRNSHNKTLGLGLCGGTKVFVCDNLAFSGAVNARRIHTPGIAPDVLVNDVLDRVLAEGVDEAGWLDGLRQIEVDDTRAKALLLDCLRADALGTMQIGRAAGIYFGAAEGNPDVAPELVERYAPRTAWSLYNVATEIYREQSPAVTLRRSRALNDVFATVHPRRHVAAVAEAA